MIKLFESQKKAINRLHNGAILCGDVGSGKSRTALAYYYITQGGDLDSEDFVKMTSPQDLYIITIAKKRDDLEWDSELRTFLLSRDPNLNVHGNKVVVDSWNNIKKYVGVKRAFFIFDEQRVVGSGVWVKSFLTIAKNNNWILLSATPGDKWTDYIPVFIANGYYRSASEFKREHCVFSPYTTYPSVTKWLNTKKLRSQRNDILVDLPTPKETILHTEEIWCEYNADKYKALMKSRWDDAEEKPISSASRLCFLLRKLCNEHPYRILAARELILFACRSIVFYNFDYELEILRTLCIENDIRYGEWNGHRHDPVPLGSKWCYLVQYTSGCEGWNCTSTDTIIFYSRNYSYRTMKQAMGRIDRLNTPYRDLYYYILTSKSPIDLAIRKAVQMKKNFNESRFIKK